MKVIRDKNTHKIHKQIKKGLEQTKKQNTRRHTHSHTLENLSYIVTLEQNKCNWIVLGRAHTTQQQQNETTTKVFERQKVNSNNLSRPGPVVPGVATRTVGNNNSFNDLRNKMAAKENKQRRRVREAEEEEQDDGGRKHKSQVKENNNKKPKLLTFEKPYF